MAEFNSAEKVKIDFAEGYSTDVMTGDRDKRMYLYDQLIRSLKKAERGYYCFFSYGIRS